MFTYIFCRAIWYIHTTIYIDTLQMHFYCKTISTNNIDNRSSITDIYMALICHIVVRERERERDPPAAQSGVFVSDDSGRRWGYNTTTAVLLLLVLMFSFSGALCYLLPTYAVHLSAAFPPSVPLKLRSEPKHGCPERAVNPRVDCDWWRRIQVVCYNSRQDAPFTGQPTENTAS